MSGLEVNLDLLERFEQELDPRFPERSKIPTRVLGYGEISTVLEIGTGAERELAYKRMPMFRSEDEAVRYQELHRDYIQVLEDRIGLRVAPCETVSVVNQRTGRVVVYIVQAKFPAEAIGHRVIQRVPAADVSGLVLAVLKESAKVFDFNRQNQGELEAGCDAQISNWAFVGLDQGKQGVDASAEIVYLDTSAPFLRQKGVERLDPELFLRSAPSFLVWILRLLFLEDVMTRYYDFRQVMVDLVANFYKEQRPELVPELVSVVGAFLAGRSRPDDFESITLDQVRSYYREDAWIWRLYLAFRRVDRTLHRLLKKDYPYVLPGKIKR
jgi:hypothetical protein